MRFAALGFTLGVWLLQHQPELPGVRWLALYFTFAAIAAIGFSSRVSAVIGAGATFIGFAALGFAWAAMLAQLRVSDRLNPELEGRDMLVSVVVAGLPQTFERGVRFDFDVESPETGVPRRIVLSSYGGFAPDDSQGVLPVRAGERWRFTVRLRRPHGGANPHGFDYEAWLLERGIRATGYVRMPSRRAGDERAQVLPERLAAMVPRPRYWIEALREAAREKIRGALPERPYAGMLIALAIGDQNAIDPGQWQLFARTGVSHLMSISGLHVTMVAGLLAMLVSWGWRRSEALSLALPAQKAAALVIVLALDPWAVLSPGFWLSFAAVAVIFFVATGRTAKAHWLAQWGRVQWAVTAGLAPLLLVLFQQVSLVSPVANALAIPLVSFVITPLALAGAVLPFDWPLALGNAILEVLMAALEWLAALPSAAWHHHAPLAWTVPLALAGIAWMLLPRGVPARWLGVPLVLPLFAVSPPSPGPGELWITVLDVGQGLAVLARTEKHALLYDAGPAFKAFSDSGSRVILPYLRGEGIDSLDALVVSHDDRDHSGGAGSVLDAMPVAVLWSSLSADHALFAAPVLRAPCVAGRKWFWDGVSFEFLHPHAEALSSRATRANNRSCVLRIESRAGRVLLTGDIERAAEGELLQRVPELLPAEALLVPHHGSGSSSMPEFVKQVAPRHAVIAVGHRNRFGHPREDVLERYREAGSELLRTDTGGAIQLRFAPGNLRVDAERVRARRYWHES